MMTKDSYNDLRDRVTKFGNDYFDNKGEALLKEMEDFISGDSKEFEEDIIENVLKSNLYSEKIKKEAEEILNDATSAKGDMVDIHKMIGAFFPLGDTFVQDEEAQPTWEKVASKPVQDSDGFWTEYTWYKNADGHHIMIFGDTDLYTPENSSADWETDSEKEAQEWFDNYEGFDDGSFNALEDYENEVRSYYEDTPNGILNLDDSCATEDSATNDTFIQDDEDLFDVIAYDWENHNRVVVIVNVPEAKATEVGEKYKEEHPSFRVYKVASKEQTKQRKDAYEKTDEYNQYAGEIDSKLEERITAESVFNEEGVDLEKLCEEIIPGEIAENEIKWECFMDYAETRKDEIEEEVKQSSEYEDLEEQAAAENRAYEAMVDYYWYHR